MVGQVLNIGCIQLGQPIGDDPQPSFRSEDCGVLGERFPRFGGTIQLGGVAIGYLTVLTQRGRVVDYLPAAFAERGRITLEQLADAVALLAECGYLAAYEDGWRARSRGDGKQRYPYG